MHPAISIIFLTTLIGAGQGLFLALYSGQLYSAFKVLPAQDPVHFYTLGSLLALALLVAGLVSSFFHLGRPGRAWRAASQWRTLETPDIGPTSRACTWPTHAAGTAE